MNKYVLVDRSSNVIQDYAIIILDIMDGETNLKWKLFTTDEINDATLFGSIEHAVGMLKVVTNNLENWAVEIYKGE